MATSQPARPDHPPTAGVRARPPIGRRLRVNLPSAELVEDAIRAGEGLIAAEGPLVVRTGKHTGRSPQDKFIVNEPSSSPKIWWGEVNRPIAEADYDRLRSRLVAYCAEKDLYSQDLLIGADPAHQRRLRVYTETAWASVFARNLFRRPTARELEVFPNPEPGRDYEIRFVCPEFTCLCPRTGQPDFATLRITYVPDRLCVELKSLKLYLWSYRDRGAFHEAVTNRVLDDLVRAVRPRRMRIEAEFYVRGGIQTTVVAEHASRRRKPARRVDRRGAK